MKPTTWRTIALASLAILALAAFLPAPASEPGSAVVTPDWVQEQIAQSEKRQWQAWQKWRDGWMAALDQLAEERTAPVYRFWSPKANTHFYTMSEAEKDSIIANYPPEVWTYEGVAFYAGKVDSQ